MLVNNALHYLLVHVVHTLVLAQLQQSLDHLLQVVCLRLALALRLLCLQFPLGREQVGPVEPEHALLVGVEQHAQQKLRRAQGGQHLHDVQLLLDPPDPLLVKLEGVVGPLPALVAEEAGAAEDHEEDVFPLEVEGASAISDSESVENSHFHLKSLCDKLCSY